MSTDTAKVSKWLSIVARILSYLAAAIAGASVAGCTLFKVSVPLV